jgi:hypothetical protein
VAQNYYYDAEGRPFTTPEATAPIAEGKSDFTKWLFSFKSQVIEPLRHTWNGEIYVDGRWKQISQPLMNDRGIMWCISYIDSYLNPSTIVTNLDDNAICFRMRQACRDIWNGLSYQYKAFELEKVNISRIANEIESKVHFILLGAKDNGYRTFFTKTYQVTEVRQSQELKDGRGGLFGGLRLFGGEKRQEGGY